MIYELSLFSGICGLSLGGKLAFGDKWRTIGYVEIEKYCQEVIKTRIKDGHLDAAPIFSDIKQFIFEGYADLYKGMADIITAGFPCQPYSVAGKRKGSSDERNLWPETIECIRRVRPRWVLLENVPGISSHDYYSKTILPDIAETFSYIEGHVISASVCETIHRRKRLWIFCTNDSGHRIQREWKKSMERVAAFSWCKDVRRFEDLQRRSDIPEPVIRGNGNGISQTVDRLKALGNAVVPQCVAFILENILKP